MVVLREVFFSIKGCIVLFKDWLGSITFWSSILIGSASTLFFIVPLKLNLSAITGVSDLNVGVDGY